MLLLFPAILLAEEIKETMGTYEAIDILARKIQSIDGNLTNLIDINTNILHSIIYVFENIDKKCCQSKISFLSLFKNSFDFC